MQGTTTLSFREFNVHPPTIMSKSFSFFCQTWKLLEPLKYRNDFVTQNRVISGFRLDVSEICMILGFDAA